MILGADPLMQSPLRIQYSILNSLLEMERRLDWMVQGE